MAICARPDDAARCSPPCSKARDLVGASTARYIDFTPEICAHSRSQIVVPPLSRSLPTGAILPAGDHVAIDPNICAAAHAVRMSDRGASTPPPADMSAAKLRADADAYREAGGAHASFSFTTSRTAQS